VSSSKVSTRKVCSCRMSFLYEVSVCLLVRFSYCRYLKNDSTGSAMRYAICNEGKKNPLAMEGMGQYCCSG
jgi:hypothetical protein